MNLPHHQDGEVTMSTDPIVRLTQEVPLQSYERSLTTRRATLAQHLMHKAWPKVWSWGGWVRGVGGRVGGLEVLGSGQGMR